MLGADVPLRRRDHDDRLLPALRRAVRHDAGRPAAEHASACVLLMYEEGFRWWNLGSAAAIAFVLFVIMLGRHAASSCGCARERAHEAAGSRGRWSARRCCSAGALVTLAPLLWMVSASLMPPGEASTFPPPLLPARADARALPRRCSRGSSWARYLAQQRCSSPVGATLLVAARQLAWPATPSRSCASAAATASSARCSAALVIPAQVGDAAAVPAAASSWASSTRYGGVIVPGLASIFGIFLVRQYALVDPRRAARRGAHRRRGRVPDLLVDRRCRCCRPILVTLARRSPSSATWNDFMWPLIVLTDDAHVHAAGGARQPRRASTCRTPS